MVSSTSKANKNKKKESFHVLQYQHFQDNNAGNREHKVLRRPAPVYGRWVKLSDASRAMTSTKFHRQLWPDLYWTLDEEDQTHPPMVRQRGVPAWQKEKRTKLEKAKLVPLPSSGCPSSAGKHNQHTVKVISHEPHCCQGREKNPAKRTAAANKRHHKSQRPQKLQSLESYSCVLIHQLVEVCQKIIVLRALDLLWPTAQHHLLLFILTDHGLLLGCLPTRPEKEREGEWERGFERNFHPCDDG